MTSPDSPATPPIPPRPAYGEYASPEHAEAARLAQLQAAQPAAPQAAPTQPPAPYTPAPGAHVYQQPYGLQPYSAQPYGQPPVPAGERPLRTGDMITSIILLAIGFFATIYATLNALSLNMQFELLYEDNGVSGGYEPTVGTGVATAVIIVSHLVLLAVAAIVTFGLIRRRRVSFWVPLVAGVLAFLIFFGSVLAVVLSDANLMEAITQQSGL